MEYLDNRLMPRHGVLGPVLRSPWFWPIAVFCYAVIGCMLVGAFAAAVAAPVQSRILVVLGCLLGLLLLTATSRLLRGIRRNRACMVLGYLEQAARLNLPLPAMLEAAESAEAGGARRALRRLRIRLEDGMPVFQALGEALSGASLREVRLIDAGERTGRLAAALRRLIEQDRAAPRRDPAGTIFLQWYPLILTAGVTGVCSLLMIFVVPRYRRILGDFHRPSPSSLQWFDHRGESLFTGLAIAAGLLVLMYVARMTATIFSPRLGRPAVLGWIIDPILWHLPVARGVVRGRGLTDVCNVLADALEAGNTPAQALADSADLKLNAVLRRRVRRWGERVRAGVPFADAARAARMPGLLVGMLGGASGNDVPRVLQFLARYYESRFSRAAELLRGAIIPTVAIGFGSVVLAMAYAVIVPLIDLADMLCSKLNQGRL